MRVYENGDQYSPLNESVGSQTFSFVNFARFGSIPPIAMATKEEEETIFVCVKVCGSASTLKDAKSLFFPRFFNILPF